MIIYPELYKSKDMTNKKNFGLHLRGTQRPVKQQKKVIFILKNDDKLQGRSIFVHFLSKKPTQEHRGLL